MKKNSQFEVHLEGHDPREQEIIRSEHEANKEEWNRFWKRVEMFLDRKRDSNEN